MQFFAIPRTASIGSLRILRIVLFAWGMLALVATAMGQVRTAELAKELAKIAVPAWQGPVADMANVLNPAEIARIRYKLADLQMQRGIYPAVLIVPGTGSQSIERYASVVFDHWVSNTEGRGDNLLLLVSVAQHRMHIGIGRSLDVRMPDAVAARIADEQAKTPFSDEDYFGGIDKAIDALAVQLGGPLLERPEVAATPLVFARNSIDTSDSHRSGGLTMYDMAGFGLMVVLLGYPVYRWRTMRLCSGGLVVLAAAFAVTHFFGSETLIHGVTGVAATAVGALVLFFALAGMRRTLERGGVRDFTLRWLAVAGLTSAMAWQARDNWIPVVITALLAMLFAFAPSGDRRPSADSGDRDNGDLPEGW